MELVRLSAGVLALELAPEIGGSIVSFTAGREPLLRPTPPEALEQGDVRRTACYPLAPYSNRIAYGRFTFGGEQHRLKPNFGDHPHTIHGVGWQAPWRVDAHDEGSATLSLDHRAGEETWPFPFRVEQRFSLTPAGLTVSLSLRNDHAQAAPAGLGLHPFFPRTEGVRLRFEADRIWENGSDHLPSRAVPSDSGWRPVGATALDNVFAGWSGSAEIRYADHDLRLEADPMFGHLVVYTPADRDYFAVEPVSHMNDAVNRMSEPGHGLRVLQPGETLAGAITFTLVRAR